MADETAAAGENAEKEETVVTSPVEYEKKRKEAIRKLERLERRSQSTFLS